MTSADVTDFANSVREQMLKALVEISEGSVGIAPTDPARPKEDPVLIKKEQPTAEAVVESNPEDAPLTAALAVDTSSVRARRNGSSSERGPETESDDGILVDRPVTPSA